MTQAKLGAVLHIVRLWNGITTYASALNEKHEACLELERQGLICRHHESGVAVTWEPLPQIFIGSDGKLYVRGEPLPPGSIDMGIIGMTYSPDTGALEIHHDS